MEAAGSPAPHKGCAHGEQPGSRGHDPFVPHRQGLKKSLAELETLQVTGKSLSANMLRSRKAQVLEQLPLAIDSYEKLLTANEVKVEPYAETAQLLAAAGVAQKDAEQVERMEVDVRVWPTLPCR